MSYLTERDGQIAFFNNYGIDYNDDNSVLVDYTDGVYNGNIFEFKLNINDLNTVLFQAIKYLSRRRIKGEAIPATILLISLNDKKVYEYKSRDYRDDIHKVYIGRASKNNNGFIAKTKPVIYDYSNMIMSRKVKKLLKEEKTIEEKYMPINIDEDCIVGWGERYYQELPKASKGDFIGDDTGEAVSIRGEIREPKHFKGLINAYTGKSNEKFKYLMDCLNDRLSKKDLGAFYTPLLYAKKAADLVLMAVERVPEGNDYIILDRCAGTGNLESALIGLKDRNGEELISHCVVSTYEYYEYKVLNEMIGDKVREIIPPTEGDVIYQSGKISNANAMSEEYINNPIIKQYINNKKCTVILFENPPYRDESSGVVNGIAERSGKKNSFVVVKMKEEIKGAATNDLANRFIWSGFKYYLRQNTDSYVVFSPIKYWKQYSFVNYEALAGFACNRKHFHATSNTITCILWSNEEKAIQTISVDAFNIIDEDLINEKKLILKKVFNPVSKFYSKIEFKETDTTGLYCDKSGAQCGDRKVRTKGYLNDSIIGYLEADSFQIASLKRNITRFSLYDGNGFYITYDNYLEKLPLWVAKMFPQDKWYEKGVYATTADGGTIYTKDKDFLKCCLIYTCLSNQNKCQTIEDLDGKIYKNELCFDTNTIASRDLAKMNLDQDEEKLINLWSTIAKETIKTSKYNPKWTYGVYQITKEINTFTQEGTGKSKKRIYDYPQLNGNLNTLRTKLKEYYKSHITQKMFKYELLK